MGYAACATVSVYYGPMPRTQIRLATPLLAALFLIAGCSSPDATEADDNEEASSTASANTADTAEDSSGKAVVSTMASLAGSYDAKFNLPEGYLEMMKGIAEASGNSIEDQMTSSDLVLILNDDGTYENAETDKGRTRSEFGTWTLSDNGKEVTLSVPNSTSGSQPGSAADDPYQMLTLFVSNDGQTLRLVEDEGEEMMTLIYIKQ